MHLVRKRGAPHKNERLYEVYKTKTYLIKLIFSILNDTTKQKVTETARQVTKMFDYDKQDPFVPIII